MTRSLPVLAIAFLAPLSATSATQAESTLPDSAWKTDPQGSDPATEAARLHDEAMSAYDDRQDTAAALRAEQAAFALNPLPGYLLNVAMFQVELQAWVPAANAFRKFLAMRGNELTPEDQRDVDGAMVLVAPHIGRIAVDADQPGATVAVDGEPVGNVPVQPWVAVEPGRHLVEVRRDGFEPFSTTVNCPADQVVTVSAMLTAVPSPEPTTLVVEEPTERDGELLGLSPWFWTAAVVGGAAAIGMAVTGGLSLSYRDDYEATGYTDVGLHDTTASLGYATDALIGIAVAGAAAALIIALWPDDEPEAGEAAPEVGLAAVPGGVAVWW